MTTTVERRAEVQASAQLETICELVAAYDEAPDRSEAQDRARENILDAPLSVSVRSDWHAPGLTDEAAEYQLLLSWGGPASQIVGELERGEPFSARLEYQDWFTPWQELAVSAAEKDTLLSFARHFYFG